MLLLFQQNCSTYVDYKINLLDDDDQFYKDAGINALMISGYGLPVLVFINSFQARRFGVGFSFSITTVLKQERTVPSAQIEQFLLALRFPFIARQKANMLMISLVPSLLSRTALLLTATVAQPPPPARQRDIILHNGNINT